MRTARLLERAGGRPWKGGDGGKRGYDGVSMTSLENKKRVLEVFRRAASGMLGELGFERRRDGSYVRTLSSDVSNLLRIERLRGLYSYALASGLSLSYVPHEWRWRPVWHRTPKSARLDLLYDDQRTLDASSEETFLEQSLEECRTQIAWLNTFTTLESVLRLAAEQWAECTPYQLAWLRKRPALACVFTLARLGREEEARSELRRLIDADHAGLGSEALEPYDDLQSALEEVIFRWRPDSQE